MKRLSDASKTPFGSTVFVALKDWKKNLSATGFLPIKTIQLLPSFPTWERRARSGEAALAAIHGAIRVPGGMVTSGSGRGPRPFRRGCSDPAGYGH